MTKTSNDQERLADVLSGVLIPLPTFQTPDSRYLSELARKHKVLAMFHRLVDGQSLAANTDLEFARSKADYAISSLQTVAEHAENLNIPLRPIKGLAMRDYYSVPADRHLGDADVMVRTFSDAKTLSTMLLRDGYEVAHFEWPWFKVQQGSRPSLYGQIQLVRFFGALWDRVDIHFGGYSVGNTAVIPGWWNRCTDLDPDPVGDLLHSCANCFGDGYFLLKDVIDFIKISDVLTEKDSWRASKIAQEVGLSGALASLAEYAQSLFGYQSNKGLHSFQEPAKSPRIRLESVHHLTRAALVTRHASSQAKQSRSVLTRASWPLRTFCSYAIPLKPRYLLPMGLGRLPSITPRLDKSRCIRMIPVSRNQTLTWSVRTLRFEHEALHFRRRKGWEIVDVGEQAFLCTSTYLAPTRLNPTLLGEA